MTARTVIIVNHIVKIYVEFDRKQRKNKKRKTLKGLLSSINNVWWSIATKFTTRVLCLAICTLVQAADKFQTHDTRHMKTFTIIITIYIHLLSFLNTTVNIYTTCNISCWYNLKKTQLSKLSKSTNILHSMERTCQLF